jgi:SsrA-binding protein
MAKERGRKLIAQNRKARHDYSIEDTYEAGLVLVGTEVISLRAGRASLVDGYALVEDGEIWLRGVNIPMYDEGSWTNHPPTRARKLLLNRNEIAKISNKMKESGLTIIPLSLYFSDGKAKVEIGIARGRKHHDKRQAIAEKDAKREVARATGRRSKGMED